MSITEFAGTDGATRANFNSRIDQANAHLADASVHITQLTCTTSSTVHALTGLTATAGIAPCVFKADANYAAGDTFTVTLSGTATAFTVVTSGGEALRAGAFLSGDIVGVKLDIDAKKLYIRQDSVAQMGLGNVDNTHDADKSVKYSATAGSAPASGGTSADTTHITSALTVTTAAPTTTLEAGKLWGVYSA